MIIYLIAVFLSFPVVASAHFGGHGVIAEVDVILIATEHVKAITEESIEIPEIGKLDKSWNKVHPSQKKLIEKGDGYYIVSFTKPKEKETLYLLLSLSGDLYDLNFSGDFEGLAH